MKKTLFLIPVTALAIIVSSWNSIPKNVADAAETETSNSSNKKKTKNPTTEITISAAGDCTLGSDRISSSSTNFYAVKNRVRNNAYFFKKVQPAFRNDDMTIVNFEGTLTKRLTRADKKFAFRGNPSYVNILKKGSIETVAFANNHCRDFGSGSYTDTIQTFKKAGIKYSSYSKTSIYKTKGKRIGMISVCVLDSQAAAQSQIKSGIKKLKKKKADAIIVSMHAGIERDVAPCASQRDVAHYAVREGADLVLGHHPHVLQGIEKYKGRYIVYSLGNFCFGGNTNPSDKDTMIFQQTFVFKNGKLRKNLSGAKVIPCSLSSVSYINNYQPKIAKGAGGQRILKKIDGYSRKLGVAVKKSGKHAGELRKL